MATPQETRPAARGSACPQTLTTGRQQQRAFALAGMPGARPKAGQAGQDACGQQHANATG